MNPDFSPLRVWLFIHIIATALWIGGTVVCYLMAAELRKLSDSQPRQALIRALGRVEVYCLLTGAAVALFSGFQLIAKRPAGMEPWLHPKLLLFLLAGITSTAAATMSRRALTASVSAESGDDESFRKASGRYTIVVAATGVMLAGAVFMVIFFR